MATLQNAQTKIAIVCMREQTSDTDRGKGVPSFDEMMDIALVEVDFDDPTTNVRGRRTSQGYQTNMHHVEQ